MVGQFRRIRRLGSLRLRLCRFLLLHATGNQRVQPKSDLLRLHGIDGPNILVVDGNGWILCCLFIYSENLWIR